MYIIHCHHGDISVCMCFTMMCLFCYHSFFPFTGGHTNPSEVPNKIFDLLQVTIATVTSVGTHGPSKVPSKR